MKNILRKFELNFGSTGGNNFLEAFLEHPISYFIFKRKQKTTFKLNLFNFLVMYFCLLRNLKKKKEDEWGVELQNKLIYLGFNLQNFCRKMIHLCFSSSVVRNKSS